MLRIPLIRNAEYSPLSLFFPMISVTYGQKALVGT